MGSNTDEKDMVAGCQGLWRIGRVLGLDQALVNRQKIKTRFSEAVELFDYVCVELWDCLQEWWTLFKLGAKP